LILLVIISGDVNVMKKEMMNILACPLCKGELVLNISNDEGEEVISGTLYCAACDEYYPIEKGIPNMLPPEMRD
jgi:uncharacterized protein YbaR (Trm112 family)